MNVRDRDYTGKCGMSPHMVMERGHGRRIEDRLPGRIGGTVALFLRAELHSDRLESVSKGRGMRRSLAED